ncbi:serine hydrolase-like protein [Leptinotarsa decemlineata]|uniref:serine hydrolase-like protein n=1 Tax=Leptinotarsa decemlineata TaxID=7539 RepID=UPI003D30678C
MKKIEEIKISVPWGYLAGKAWGESNDPVVICTHGFMDNAGSFDTLIPHLPNSFYYVSIDLPGHGRSSHFPPHLPIHTLNYLLVYKYVSKYYGKYIILAHSYGAQIGLLYTQLYPDCVQKLVMLDAVILFPVSTKHFKDYLSKNLENFVKNEEKLLVKQAPSYTLKEAFLRVQNGRNYSQITKQAAQALLTRAVTEVENGRYRFNLDPRIRYSLLTIHDLRYILETLKSNPVCCPVLFILGKDSSAQQVYMGPIIRFLKTQKNVIFQIVDGDHDVHMNHPEKVAPHVAEFLLQRKGKL